MDANDTCPRCGGALDLSAQERQPSRSDANVLVCGACARDESLLYYAACAGRRRASTRTLAPAWHEPDWLERVKRAA